MDAVSLLHLPPQRLPGLAGTVRDVWTDSTAGQNLRWMLRLVELRGADAKTYVPAGTEQLIMGISGPQVRIGAGRGVPLRRDRALAHDAALVEMHRPADRPGGTSRLLILAFDPRVVSAQATFDELDGDGVVSPDTEALVVLRGRIAHAGADLEAHSVAILRPPVVGAFQTTGARILTLAFSDAHPSVRPAARTTPSPPLLTG